MSEEKPKRPQAPKKKFPIVNTEVTLFLFSLALFMTLPVNKNLILTKVCYEKFQDMNFCRNSSNPAIGMDDYVQKRTASFTIYVSICYFIPAGFAAIMAGSWADKFGRKFPLLIPPFGMIIGNTILALFSAYLKEAPSWIYPVASIPSGITGGELIVISASINYVAAISDVKHRIRSISILSAMISIPSTIGPLIALSLIKQFGPTSVYIGTICLGFVTLLYNAFVLKENNPENVEKKTFKNLFNPKHFLESARVVVRKRSDKKRKYIILTLLAMFIYYSLVIGSGELMYLFVKDAPLSWSFSQYTTLLSANSGVTGVLMLIVFPLFRHFVSFRDTSLVVFSSFMAVFGYSILAVATSTALVYISTSFFILSSFVSVGFRTVLSKFVQPEEEGKMFSIIAVLENVGFVISGAVFNSVWPYTRSFFRGILFEGAALCTMIYVVINIYVDLKLRIQDKKKSSKSCELTSIKEISDTNL